MEVRIYYGRGGWSWYTGSSSWYYRCGIENLLGLKKEKNMRQSKNKLIEMLEYVIADHSVEEKRII